MASGRHPARVRADRGRERPVLPAKSCSPRRRWRWLRSTPASLWLVAFSRVPLRYARVPLLPNPFRSSSVRASGSWLCRTETPGMRGELVEEMKNQKGMDVSVLVKRTIAGIGAGTLCDSLWPHQCAQGSMNRIAPQFVCRQTDGPETGREAHGASAADAAALCSEGRAAGGFASGGGFRALSSDLEIRQDPDAAGRRTLR